MLIINFKGFSPKAPIFLKEVHYNNSKQWFEEHKSDYISLIKDPFYEMAELLAPTIKKIDSQIMIDPRRILSRINTDARFAARKGQGRYRNSAWLSFRRPIENWLEFPTFFFEITEDYCRYGMGFYFTSASKIAIYRKYIAQNPQHFKNAVKIIDEDINLHPEGESYKRPKEGCPKGLEKWYNFKSFYITANKNLDFIGDTSIIEIVSKDFLKLKPLYIILADELSEVEEN